MLCIFLITKIKQKNYNVHDVSVGVSTNYLRKRQRACFRSTTNRWLKVARTKVYNFTRRKPVSKHNFQSGNTIQNGDFVQSLLRQVKICNHKEAYIKSEQRETGKENLFCLIRVIHLRGA